MKILPINTLILNPRVKAGNYGRPILRSFCYASDTVSFKSTEPEFTNLPKEDIFKRVDDSIKPENVIGIGSMADVYSINDTDYCIRLLKADLEQGLSKKYLNYKESFSKDLSQLDKANHVVINLGNQASIMKRIKGVPVNGLLVTADESVKIAEEIAKFPVNSYINLYKHIVEMQKEGILFDPHPSNLIVNLESKSFTTIDMLTDAVKIPFEPMAYLFMSLVHENTPSECRRSIINKLLKTLLEDLCSDSKPMLNYQEYDFIPFLEEYSNRFFQDILEAGLDGLSLGHDISKLLYLKFSEEATTGARPMIKRQLKDIYKKIDKVFPAKI